MLSLTKITATAFFATAVSLVALGSVQGQEEAMESNS